MISVNELSSSWTSMGNVSAPQTDDRKAASAPQIPRSGSIESAKDILSRHPELGILCKDERMHRKDSYDFCETTFRPAIDIVYPSDLMLASIADYYKTKYDINIKIVSHYINLDDYARPFDNPDYSDVLQSLTELAEELTDDSQVGVIVRFASAHATPIIISKYHQKCHLIVMDCLGLENAACYSMNPIFYTICKVVNKINSKCGEQRYFPVFTDLQRQSDNYSCKNDALLMLKDALRENIMDKLDFYQESLESVLKIPFKLKLPASALVARLPIFLHKTVQRKDVLDKISPQAKRRPFRKTVTPTTATKNLHHHLRRHTHQFTAVRTRNQRLFAEESRMASEKDPNPILWETTVEEKTWQINTYLQQKPLKWVVKAYERLKAEDGKIDPAVRKKLLNLYIH